MPISVPQLPDRLRWSHNEHFHPLILRRFPARVTSALDVGCGAGELARKLAGRSGRVDAIDPDPGMIAAARAAGGSDNIRWLPGDVFDAELPVGGYDLVTALSSLHHLPLRAGLARLAGLVAPGVTLVVVGVYRPATLSDFALEAVSIPANWTVGLWLAASGRTTGTAHPNGMPVRPAEHTLAEIGDAAREFTPRARIRRHVFWRYSLVWRRGRA